MTVRLATLSDIPAIRAHLADASEIALDTEFHAENRFIPRLYLVQIHTDAGTWILDPEIPALLPELADSLRACAWIVHGGEHDMRVLAAALGGLPDTVWDTQIAAGLVQDDFPAKYVDLVAQWLERTIDKSATLSDWSRRPLSPEQLRYAAEDVRSLQPLWRRLWQRLGELNRHDAVRAACAEARTEVLDPSGPDEDWRRIPAASVLSAKQAGVLQELVVWRDAVARATDQPPGAVASNALIVGLARRLPTTAAALTTDRRFPRRVLKRYGDELVEVIRRAARRPEWAWPTPVARASPRWRKAQWLECLVDVIGATHHWSPRLVLPRERIETLVAAGPTTPDELGALLGDWRDGLAGTWIWDGLTGKVSLTLDPEGAVQAMRHDPGSGYENFS